MTTFATLTKLFFPTVHNNFIMFEVYLQVLFPNCYGNNDTYTLWNLYLHFSAFFGASTVHKFIILRTTTFSYILNINF